MKNKRYIALIMMIVLMVTMLTACRTAQKFDDVGAEVPEIPASVQTIVVEQTDVPNDNTTVITQTETTTVTESETTTTSDAENTTASTEATGSENTSTSEDIPEPDPEKPISCMSFNILNGNGNNNDYSDPEIREKWVVEIVKEQDPDLIGFQETGYMSIAWKDELHFDLCDDGDYDCRSLEEENAFSLGQMNTGAGLIIFWKRNRFELLDSGCHEYTQYSRQVRYFQWVKLYDKVYDKTVFMTNTHLSIDSDSQSADKAGGLALRTSEAQELYNFWKKNVTGDAVLFATGDYNAQISEPAHKTLQTGNKFQPSINISDFDDGNTSIDFVYTSPATISVSETAVLSYSFKDRVENQNLANTYYRASDHNPAMTWAHYK